MELSRLKKKEISGYQVIGDTVLLEEYLSLHNKIKDIFICGSADIAPGLFAAVLLSAVGDARQKIRRVFENLHNPPPVFVIYSITYERKNAREKNERRWKIASFIKNGGFAFFGVSIKIPHRGKTYGGGDANGFYAVSGFLRRSKSIERKGSACAAADKR
jgi:hypothetical protein